MAVAGLVLLAISDRVKAVEVDANGELLVGETLEDSGIHVFRGVPFAAPPVGQSRWAAPAPYRPAASRRDATRFAPACMQSMRILEWYRDMAEIFGSTRDEFEDLEVSEDCLYLNIWTQSLDDSAKLPVMVYVHGGSNSSGWAYEPDYRGHVLAGRGVVLVSIAYRLGVFGFWSHPDLDGEAVANFGLHDQLAALRWIREHVSAFGGDPDRVTVFGESAGAQDILALMASPAAKGLFHGAILQSNPASGLWADSARTLADERARGIETARILGVDSVAALRGIPARQLLEEYEAAISAYHSPAIDGQLLHEPIWEAAVAGRLADIPFIIGSNADERYDGAPANASMNDVLAAFARAPRLDSAASRQAVAGEPDFRERIDRILAADSFYCPSERLADVTGRGYVYYFSRVREGEGGARVRAYHGAELPYTFGTHPSWMTTTDVDRRLTDQILGYWASFAATGRPGKPGLPEWTPFALGEQVMTFGSEAMLTGSPEPVLCRAYEDSLSRSHSGAHSQ